jgi:hypothetical protein
MTEREALARFHDWRAARNRKAATQVGGGARAGAVAVRAEAVWFVLSARIIGGIVASGSGTDRAGDEIADRVPGCHPNCHPIARD